MVKFIRKLRLFLYIAIPCILISGLFLRAEQKYRDNIASGLYSIYSHSFPTPEAYNKAMDGSFDYKQISDTLTQTISKNEQKLKKTNGLHGRDSILWQHFIKADIERNIAKIHNLEMFRFIFTPLYGITLIGIILASVLWLFLLLQNIFNFIKIRHFEKDKYIRIGLLTGVLTIALLSCSLVCPKNSFEELHISFLLQDYTFETYGSLVELSNYFYKIPLAENDFTALKEKEYIKLKTQGMIEELKKLESIKSKGIIDFNSDEIVMPLIRILGDIVAFCDIATDYKDPLTQAKSIALFDTILEKLDSYYDKTYKYIRCFPKEINLIFSPEAIETYKKIKAAPPDSKFSIYQLFGYRLYERISIDLQDSP